MASTTHPQHPQHPQLNPLNVWEVCVQWKLDFYVGNTGVPLKKCGNLKACTSEEIIEWIASSEDNYYETKTIHYEDLLAAVRNDELTLSKENYVYPNVIAAVLAMVCNGRKK